jgi:hypothetical protein
MDIRVGQVWRPKSGNGRAIAIVDFAGPGLYIVRNAAGDGDTWTMTDRALARYAFDPTAIAY